MSGPYPILARLCEILKELKRTRHLLRHPFLNLTDTCSAFMVITMLCLDGTSAAPIHRGKDISSQNVTNTKLASFTDPWNFLPRNPSYNLYPSVSFAPPPKSSSYEMPIRNSNDATKTVVASQTGAQRLTTVSAAKRFGSVPYLIAVHGDPRTYILNEQRGNVSDQWTYSNGVDNEKLFVRYKDPQDYSGALAYIVFVLIFYSTAIVIMMAKYMRREHKEYQDAKKYQKYVKSAREVYMRSISRSRATNKLALQAFNTVNLIPQITNNQERPKITYV